MNTFIIGNILSVKLKINEKSNGCSKYIDMYEMGQVSLHIL